MDRVVWQTTLLASLLPLLGWGNTDAGEDLPGWGEGLGSFCPHLSPFPRCSQCLKPEDVAEAVIYVLSMPPHVQVSLALAVCPLEEPSQPRGGEWEGLKRVGRASRLPQALFVPSADWRHPDEAHRAGDLVPCGEFLLPAPPLQLGTCPWTGGINF